jgi:lycopene cyclase domain-containing protein
VALLALLVAIYVWKQPELLGFFLLAWLVALLPKLVVNGILTSLPVVSYNPEHIIGLRVGTIPVEDFFYFFGLLLLNVMVYENLKRHKEV